MTERIAAGRKTDPFEDLLLEEARLCHTEMQLTFAAIRNWEQAVKDNKVKFYDAVDLCQRELGNIRGFVEDTTRLANAAARLRGQNIRVTRAIAPSEGEGVSENANSIPQENIAANDAAKTVQEVAAE